MIKRAIIINAIIFGCVFAYLFTYRLIVVHPPSKVAGVYCASFGHVDSLTGKESFEIDSLWLFKDHTYRLKNTAYDGYVYYDSTGTWEKWLSPGTLFERSALIVKISGKVGFGRSRRFNNSYDLGFNEPDSHCIGNDSSFEFYNVGSNFILTPEIVYSWEFNKVSDIAKGK